MIFDILILYIFYHPKKNKPLKFLIRLIREISETNINESVATRKMQILDLVYI